MTRTILLDTGPLGMVTNPNSNPKNQACTAWLLSQARANHRIVIPEIADYELRRELLRAGKTSGLARLEQFISRFEFLPLNTASMRNAASFWAEARRLGQPTASDAALDGDMILVGQWQSLNDPIAIIATTNVQHISRFANTALWEDITD
jgi:predicted nucleic acid-binding protein